LSALDEFAECGIRVAVERLACMSQYDGSPVCRMKVRDKAARAR
jgi:hypothetical protein